MGLFIALISVVRLHGFNKNWDIGIDRIIFANKLAGNEMALNTVVCFLLIGVAFFLTDDRKKGNLIPTQLFASLVFVISLLTVIGFLYVSGIAFYILRQFNSIHIRHLHVGEHKVNAGIF